MKREDMEREILDLLRVIPILQSNGFLQKVSLEVWIQERIYYLVDTIRRNEQDTP